MSHRSDLSGRRTRGRALGPGFTFADGLAGDVAEPESNKPRQDREHTVEEETGELPPEYGETIGGVTTIFSGQA